MRRIAPLGIVVAVVLASVVPACSVDDPYLAYRQADTQEIPGTFGWLLHPAGDAVPALSPARAFRQALTGDEDGEVLVSLAVLEDEAGGRTPLSWVFVTRHLCYFTAKGDLVSPSRSGRDPCTDDNLLVQAIDADTGDLIRVVSAFDHTQGWTPRREGTPGEGQDAATTRFH